MLLHSLLGLLAQLALFLPLRLLFSLVLFGYFR